MPKTSKKIFKKLNRALEDADLDRTDIEAALGKSRSYVAERFQGKRQWELEEMYIILGLLRAPASQLNEYFPRGGIDLENVSVLRPRHDMAAAGGSFA